MVHKFVLKIADGKWYTATTTDYTKASLFTITETLVE
jgi:hypothetical protein